jgi:UDP-N-acetylmuramate--alanine ligase
MKKLSVHLIGIGGSGLSAIARLLLESGYQVSGSDRQLTPMVQTLQSAGARVSIGHRAENIGAVDLVIRSSAIHDENVEVQAARNAGIPVLKRVEFIGQLMAGRRGIAVAGSHGKTTTTAMITWLLVEAGKDPTYIIGGVPKNLGLNAHAGTGTFFVIEADEYDHMFLGLAPEIAVVTNVDYDHPDCYPTPQDFYLAFVNFTQRLTPDGCLIACSDNGGSRQLLKEASKQHRVVSYGLELLPEGVYPDFRAANLFKHSSGAYSFDVYRKDERVVELSLQIPGKHNILNALASLAVVDLIELPVVDAARALNGFLGTGRRFELRGEVAGITVIDDYAHHPCQIRATLAAARDSFPGRVIWAVWQPHTYSRTQALWDEFITAFKDADHVVLTEVYAARELSPADFSTQKLASEIRHTSVKFIPDLDKVTDFLQEHLHPGDVLLVLSAGDADRIGARLLQKMQSQIQAG